MLGIVTNPPEATKFVRPRLRELRARSRGRTNFHETVIRDGGRTIGISSQPWAHVRHYRGQTNDRDFQPALVSRAALLRADER